MSNSHKEEFPIEEQWPSTTNCLCFTLYPRPLGKRSAFIGRLCQSSCAHKSRETGFLECGGWVCWIEQTSKAPEGIRDQGKRQNNLRTTSGRMRHPPFGPFLCGYLRSVTPAQKEGEVLPGQPIRWCCIDPLRSYLLSGVGFWTQRSLRGPVLVADSLCPGRENRTMRER